MFKSLTLGLKTPLLCLYSHVSLNVWVCKVSAVDKTTHNIPNEIQDFLAKNDMGFCEVNELDVYTTSKGKDGKLYITTALVLAENDYDIMLDWEFSRKDKTFTIIVYGEVTVVPSKLKLI